MNIWFRGRITVFSPNEGKPILPMCIRKRMHKINPVSIFWKRDYTWVSSNLLDKPDFNIGV